MELQYSVVERKINKFIEKYGAAELINYLEKYDTIVNKNDYGIWLEAKLRTSQEFGIPVAELDGIYPNVDARRVLVHICDRHVRMNRKAMAQLLNLSLRSIEGYIQYTDFMCSEKGAKVRADFHEHYHNILNKFKEWLSSRKI